MSTSRQSKAHWLATLARAGGSRIGWARVGDPSQSLVFVAVPNAIDVSTTANPQVFDPQFGIANIGTDTVSIARARLLVPVTLPSPGINLASSATMTPNAETTGWSFKAMDSPKPAYVAFELLPSDGEGSLAPGDGVAFILSGVNVAAVAGPAVLDFSAVTSLGSWDTTATIMLTKPSTTPEIKTYAVIPADPPTLTTLQGQSVVVSWTTSGAAYCNIRDDQGNKWLNQPTSGVVVDTPQPGSATVTTTPQLGRNYSRTYTLYAWASGGVQSDQQPNSATIQLPTVFTFTATPAPLEPWRATNLAWSLANVDPNAGSIALTVTPGDGTPSSQLSIPPTALAWQGTVSPISVTATAYKLALDNGFGATTTAQQGVGSPIRSGWNEEKGLETLSVWPVPLQLPCMTTYGGMLWFAFTSNGSAPYSLRCKPRANSWAQLTPKPALAVVDGLIAADLGDGEMLWAFGTQANSNRPFVACSNDGTAWQTMPQPPYAVRQSGSYLAVGSRLLVMGGTSQAQSLTDVWSSVDGRAWTQIGNAFPGSGANGTVAIGKTLITVPFGTTPLSYMSTNTGATWSAPQSIPVQATSAGCSLQQFGDQVWLLGANGSGIVQPGTAIAVFDLTKWWVNTQLVLPQVNGQVISSAVLNNYLWVGISSYQDQSPAKFFMLNQTAPGTTFSLVPPPSEATH